MYGITCPAPGTFRRVVQLARTGRIRPLVEKAHPLEELRHAQVDLIMRRQVAKLTVEI